MLIKFNLFLISLLPVFLITGPFLPNLVISLCAIFFIFFCFKSKNINFIFFKSKIIIFFLIFLISIIVSSLLSDFPLHSLENSLFYLRFAFFAFFLSYLINSYEDIVKYFFYVLFFCFSILIFDVFFQNIFKFNVFNFPLLDNRATSFFKDEYILGSFLSRLFHLFLAIAYYKGYFKKYNELIIVTLIFLASFCVYLTGERVALFNIIITTVFLTILLESKKLKYLLLLGSVFLYTYLLFFSNSIINNRIIQNTINQLGIFSEQKHFFSKYIEAYYMTSLNMFYSSPLLGLGPKNYRLFCDNPNYAYLVQANLNCSTHPHGIFFQLLAETGIIGAVLYLILIMWLIYVFFIFLLKCFSNLKNFEYKYNFFLILCLFINISPFLPSGSIFNSWLNTIYYIVLGFLIHANKLIKYK